MKKLASMIISVFMMVATVFGVVGCGGAKAQTDAEYIKSKGTLVVGVTVYPPMDYIGDDGEWTGFDADLAKQLGKDLGLSVQIVIITWSQKVAELKSKNIDLIWNGMTASEELGEEIDFSVSYAENKQVAVVQSDNTTITDEATLKNAKIAVEASSAGDKVATDVVKATDISRVEAQNNALLEVVSGASQAAVIDYTMAVNVVGKGDYAALKIVEGVEFGREVFAVGLRKGSDFKAEVDAFFKKYYENGTLQTLAEKYMVALNTEALAAL